jgi:8-oxo-dGTP diphosphatase
MEWARKATGSAVVITNERGEVLVLRRSCPPFDWVLPGGGAEAGESPIETALREVREETGLDIELDRMTGVYYQADHRAGEFIHFVFAAVVADDVPIRPDPGEAAEYGLFSLDHLPEPMSPSTRLRLLDALKPDAARLPVTLPPRAEG